MTISNVKAFLKRNTIIPIFIVFFAVFSIFVDNFLTSRNLLSLLNQKAPMGVMAIGMTFLIINGYFDLSAGTLMGLCCTLTIGLQPYLGTVLSIIIALIAGILIGSLNGFLVSRVGMNAFVVTLASMQGTRGLNYLVSGERALTGIDAVFAELGKGKLLGLYNQIWLYIILMLLGIFILKYTKHGRDTYATGGNTLSSANAGINVKKVTYLNFTICSLTCSIAGIMYAARMNASVPTLGWPDLHMNVIAAVVLGGSKLSGGFGNLLYTLGGVLVLSFIDNALNLLNVQTYWSSLITGAILIFVLYLDKVLREKKK